MTGPKALFSEHFVDLDFVIKRMAENATPDQLLEALAAFAEAVGDHGYATIFRDKLDAAVNEAIADGRIK